MKNISTIVLFMMFLFGAHAQGGYRNKYFLLEDNSEFYKLSKIKLNGSKQIQLYNLLFDESKLLLFSIIPTKSDSLWEEVEINEIKSQIINFEQLKGVFSLGFDSYQKSGGYDVSKIKRDDITVVIRDNDKYYASKFCFAEYFVIINQKLVFQNLMGNVFINMWSPILGVKDFEKKYTEAYGTFSPNSISERHQTGTTELKRPLEKPLLFHSGVQFIFNRKGFKFWQFNDWHISDGTNYYRGVDRFLYLPNIGIVGGSFDAFFEKKSNEVLQKEYMEEELMLPLDETDIKIYR